MKIKILNHNEAEKFVPSDRTYAIRIGSPGIIFEQLVDSPLYVRVNEYIFNDRYPRSYPLRRFITSLRYIDRIKIFEEKIAKSILNDFKQSGIDSDTLLVHCRHGGGRSPAVALAINEIFDLGESSLKIKLKFPGFNTFVYHELIKASKTL